MLRTATVIGAEPPSASSSPASSLPASATSSKSCSMQPRKHALAMTVLSRCTSSRSNFSSRLVVGARGGSPASSAAAAPPPPGAPSANSSGRARTYCIMRL